MITLIKISSCDLPYHPAYVTVDMAQAEKICELLGTSKTVWCPADIDELSSRAAKGEFDMHTAGSYVTISFKRPEPLTSTVSPFDFQSENINRFASLEGWALFNGNEILRISVVGRFKDDDEAIEFVERLADQGSLMHKIALAIHNGDTDPITVFTES